MKYYLYHYLIVSKNLVKNNLNILFYILKKGIEIIGVT